MKKNLFIIDVLPLLKTILVWIRSQPMYLLNSKLQIQFFDYWVGHTNNLREV